MPFLKATAPGCWSGILFYVAWNMSDAHRFASGLVVAVNVGVVLASLLFMRRMSKAVSIEEHSQEQVAADVGRGADFVLPKNTVVYSIDGPFFFGAAEYLEKTLRRSQNQVRTSVIRMGRVPFMEGFCLSAVV